LDIFYFVVGKSKNLMSRGKIIRQGSFANVCVEKFGKVAEVMFFICRRVAERRRLK